MNEVITHEYQGQGPAESIMGQQGMSMGAGANVGAVAIEQQRAIAEAQGQLILAKKFPRNLNAAYAELMEACKVPALAQVAFYTLPRGKSSVTGPSIRLAEEIARAYGNFQYGHRELSRDDKKSEVEVYAWDMEKNNYSKRQLTVMHVMDTKEGPRKLRDQKDIDDKIANVASKQVRGRILALVPKWFSEGAIAECRKTLAGNNEAPIGERVRRMTQAFAKFGVTVKHLEAFLGHSLDQVDQDELVDLTGVHNAIRDGAKVGDYFGDADEQQTNQAAAAALAKQAEAGAQQREQAATKSAATRKLADKKPKPEPVAEAEHETQPAAQVEPETSTQQLSNSEQNQSNDLEESPVNFGENSAAQTADSVVEPQSQQEGDDVF